VFESLARYKHTGHTVKPTEFTRYASAIFLGSRNC